MVYLVYHFSLHFNTLLFYYSRINWLSFRNCSCWWCFFFIFFILIFNLIELIGSTSKETCLILHYVFVEKRNVFFKFTFCHVICCYSAMLLYYVILIDWLSCKIQTIISLIRHSVSISFFNCISYIFISITRWPLLSL